MGFPRMEMGATQLSSCLLLRRIDSCKVQVTFLVNMGFCIFVMSVAGLISTSFRVSLYAPSPHSDS